MLSQPASANTDEVVLLAPETELTGKLETDYLHLCKLNNFVPLNIHKLPYPLPPIPMPQPEPAFNSRPTSRRISMIADTIGEVVNEDDIDAVAAANTNANAAPQTIASGVNIQRKTTPSRPEAREDTRRASIASHHLTAGPKSRYRFLPTLILEAPEDEPEEVYKVEIRGWVLPQGTAEVLGLLLGNLQNVTHLSLWNVSLSDSALLHLITGILSSNIRHLSLDYTTIHSENNLSYLFIEDSPLRHVSLRGNKITSMGVKSIANKMKWNRSLGSLNLAGNKICCNGADAIADALKVNTTLFALSLSQNPIGDEGVKSLARILSSVPMTPEERKFRASLKEEREKLMKELDEDVIVKGVRKRRPGSARRSEDFLGKTPDVLMTNAQVKPVPPTATKTTQPPADAKKAPAKPAPSAKNDKKPAAPVKEDPKDPKKKDTKGAAASLVKKEEKKDEKPGLKRESSAGVPGKKVGDGESDTASLDTFEHGGSHCILGNRTLASLNFCGCSLTDESVKALWDAVHDQEVTMELSENAAAGCGLVRVCLSDNRIDTSSSNYTSLMSILNTRNTYRENEPEGQEMTRDDSNMNENN